MPYVYQPYPKYVIHATEAPRIVQTEAEHRALGPGWGVDEVVAPVEEPPAKKAPKKP